MLQQDYSSYVSKIFPQTRYVVNLLAQKSGYENERYQDGNVERQANVERDPVPPELRIFDKPIVEEDQGHSCEA